MKEIIKDDYNKKYKKIYRIGFGGFSDVYECELIENNEKKKEKRAIKIIEKDKYISKMKDFYKEKYEGEDSNDNNIIFTDIFREIEIMKIIEGENEENKNTVKFYECYETDNEFAIVMELCDGSLKDLIKKKNLMKKKFMKY